MGAWRRGCLQRAVLRKLWTVTICRRYWTNGPRTGTAYDGAVQGLRGQRPAGRPRPLPPLPGSQGGQRCGQQLRTIQKHDLYALWRLAGDPGRLVSPMPGLQKDFFTAAQKSDLRLRRLRTAGGQQKILHKTQARRPWGSGGKLGGKLWRRCCGSRRRAG